MADRPTKQIETPIAKAKVVLYEWATGGDKRAMSNLRDDPKRQELMIERLIVSINDSTEQIIKALDDMHGKDFDFVMTAIGEILTESSLTAEKKTS